MAASGINEAVRNNVAVGGRRISLLDNFSWGNPEKADRLGGLLRAVEACHDFSLALRTPFISGKDSLYNESPFGPVTPTLLITGLGIIPDVRKTISLDLKESGNLIYIIGETLPELGGSEYYRLMGVIGNSVPKVDGPSMKRTMNAISVAMDLGYVTSCHDLSEGGIAVAAAEMAFTGGYGLEMDLRMVPKADINREDFIMFSESNSRFLVEVPKDQHDGFEEIMADTIHSIIGRVNKDQNFTVLGLKGDTIIDIDIARLREAWKSTFGE
jgi:phosphoribosylformylglycinamidine synthase